MILIPIVLTTLCADPSSKPTSEGREIIDKMIAARRAFSTAEIRWTYAFSGRGGLPPQTRYLRNRFAADSWTAEDVGDDDGMVLPVGDARWNGNIELVIPSERRQWQVKTFTPPASTYASPELGAAQLNDGRCLGILPVMRPGIQLDEILRRLCNSPSDEAIHLEHASNDVKIVSVDMRNAGGSAHWTVRWWVDSTKGYNPIRTELLNEKGVASAVAVSELAIFDGRWFPKRVSESRVRGDGQGAQVDTVGHEIAAEFDRPSHPLNITPYDIGMVPYMQVNVIGSEHPPEQFVWTGTGKAEGRDIRKLVADGMMKKSQFASWEARAAFCEANNWGKTPPWARDPVLGVKPESIDEWTAYVRRFGKLHGFDEKQVNSGKGILDDCKATAAKISERDKTKREAGIADIFNKELVPRLNSLLTESQRHPPDVKQPPMPAIGPGPPAARPKGSR